MTGLPYFLLTTLQKHQKEAAAIGISLLGPSDLGRKYRTYSLPCGHRVDLVTSNVRRGNSKCPTCQSEKLQGEAAAHGLTLVQENGGTKLPNVYRMPCCGTSQKIFAGHVRAGSYKCRSCNESHWDKPSNIYILTIKTKNASFCKLGYASSIPARISQIGAQGTVEVFFEAPFASGRDAQEVEQACHKLYSESNLSPAPLRKLLKSGFSERYPLKLAETLAQSVAAHPLLKKTLL